MLTSQRVHAVNSVSFSYVSFRIQPETLVEVHNIPHATITHTPATHPDGLPCRTRRDGLARE
jgi:hypothetical protein